MHEQGIIRDYIQSNQIKEDMCTSSCEKNSFFDGSSSIPTPRIPDVAGEVSCRIFQYLKRNYQHLLVKIVCANESPDMAAFQFIIRQLLNN